MKFEWHDEKDKQNKAKHGVSFQLAADIFLDAFRLESEDTRKNYGETRYITLPLTQNLWVFSGEF
jgi:uncharacterized protein